MRTVKPAVLSYMIGQLDKYRVLCSMDIAQWETHSGMYLGNGEYTYDENSYSTIRLGETWTAMYDCARWFHAKVTLPDAFMDKKLYLEIDFGGEALVKINGDIAGGISSKMNSGWVHRDCIFMPSAVSSVKVFDIEIEASVNAGGFCDAAMDGATTFDYFLNIAKISAIDERCESFLFDINLIWEALPHIADQYIKNKVYNALDNAVHIVDFDFDEQTVRSSIYAAKTYLDKALSSIQHIPQCRVLMQGHSHIDLAWLWRIQETERKAARTFSNNLALMERYPDFTFAQSQAILYDMAKRLYPALFEKIKERVKSGQWDIVGNVWVEADTNLASGESLIRQLLYGRAFFKKEFSVSSDIYWLPDCFGFSWALPQIIKRSGMKYFITSKLVSQDTNRFPHNIFRWKGNDGSEIIAYMQRVHYQTDYTAEDIAKAAIENDQKDVLPESFGMFGYGDGGGGCTYGMVERGRRLRNFPGLPSSEIGHVDDFFQSAERERASLPEYNDELYYENHRGTYTSQAFLKKGNRRGEFLLSRAEMASIFAKNGADLPYEKDRLEDVWKILLQNQFHDILPGTSIHPAMEDCRPDYERITLEGSAIKERALLSLNAKIHTETDGIVVWNLLGHTVSAPVMASIDHCAVVVDTAGIRLPQTCVQDDKGNFNLTFVADSVPPMGYKIFPFTKVNEWDTVLNCVHATRELLENNKLRVFFDEHGLITSLYDKCNEREVLCGQSNKLTIFQDKCVHETAWNLELNYQKKYWELKDADSIEVVEQSAVRGILRIIRSFNKSKVTQDVILWANADHVHFDTSIEWYEHDKVLKASFDVDILNNEATFETAHGAIKRPTHWNTSYDRAKYEQCAHKWADLSEGDYGVSILNDCKYGYDIKNHCMRITLMRAPTCPDRTGDIGSHSFVYAIYPHKGVWHSGGTVHRSFELNVPLTAYSQKAQNGSLPAEHSFLRCEGKSIVIDTIKEAEDGDGIILRVYEAEQSRGTTKILLSLAFSRIIECNLMEENEKELTVEDNSFSFPIKPFEVKTFRITS